MWVNVLKTFKDACGEAEATYLAKIKSLCPSLRFESVLINLIGFNFTDEQNIAFILNMRMRTWHALRSSVCEKPVILEKLRNDFKKYFLNDEHGNPRMWTLFDNIYDAFQRAKGQVCVAF